jgi:nitroimidazol reductase NimA-like FMN-containing flavoprotein (pyridoxamine 5'-phosphate oxidase superfamily)
MFIHEMSASECREALAHAHVGRLACARDNQPYIVPMNFAVDGDYLYVYGFTTVGQKVEWMRSNPLVCFEIDDVVDHNRWMSVIIFGQYEELPDKPEFESARNRAYAHLQKRVMWWEPAYISQNHRDQANSLIPLFFRIKIEKMTGHRANSDYSEAPIKEVSNVKSKLTHTDVFERQWTRIIKAAVVYFVIVFGAGSVLGLIRTLLVVPRLGDRMAELIELPVMLMIIFLAAKFIVDRFHLPPSLRYRLGAGVLAFAFGVVFEFGVFLKLRGLTLPEYFQTRDPIAIAAYYLALVLLALMPLIQILRMDFGLRMLQAR